MIAQVGTGLPVTWVWYGADGVYRLHVAADRYSSPDTYAGGNIDPDTYSVIGRQMTLYQASSIYDDGSNAKYMRVKPANITTRAWLRKA